MPQAASPHLKSDVFLCLLQLPRSFRQVSGYSSSGTAVLAALEGHVRKLRKRGHVAILGDPQAPLASLQAGHAEVETETTPTSKTETSKTETTPTSVETTPTQTTSYDDASTTSERATDGEVRINADGGTARCSCDARPATARSRAFLSLCHRTGLVVANGTEAAGDVTGRCTRLGEGGRVGDIVAVDRKLLDAGVNLQVM